jgi:hypothetical protein
MCGGWNNGVRLFRLDRFAPGVALCSASTLLAHAAAVDQPAIASVNARRRPESKSITA